ncbi:MAG: phosphatase PAP2 family protein, partial [Deltaproteobacteria bacterium]|nr:phosphatase PAP2 family protein [Deltaproteobacteria bacterium]
LLWASGGIGIRLGVDQHARWTEVNSFDNAVRDDFRLGSSSARSDAATASDVLLIFNATVLPLAGIGWTAHGDSENARHDALEMGAEAAEALSLTLFITEATKAIAGRERPYVQNCDGPSPPGRCDRNARKKSFFSGHASFAAAGAGLACSHSIKRKTWGETMQAKVIPCAFGAGVAVTTGALRMAADKHWFTDVLVGLAVGGVIGYYDSWGPFDLLRFETDPPDGTLPVQGVVLPYTDGHTIGARVAMRF